MKAEKVRSCLRDYVYTSNEDWDELHELERLAEIGRALERAFPRGVGIKLVDSPTQYDADFTSVDDLLEWYEAQQSNT